MDIKTLKTFQAIVKTGSFIRAAQEMNYAQSTVTMQIQKLESELGVRLIERGKDIVLTEAGRLFFDESLHIVRRMEHLQTSVSHLRSGEAGHVRIGVTEPTASYRLPKLLKRFMAEKPNIRISVDVSNTSLLSERIRKGEIDFALCTAPGIGTELYYEPLFQETFVALLPEGHALARKEVIGPEDLSGHRLLVTSESCPYRRKLEIVMRETGNGTFDTMEVGSMTALKFYVESGLGVALVPEIVANGERAAGTEVRKIGGSLIGMTFGLLCKESAYRLQPAGRRLYDYLKQELTEL
jgi:DNA-binding transcriptional LysR family regulator